MPFSTLEFVFLFLPLSLIGFYTLIWLGWRDKSYLFLLAASLVFYGVNNPKSVFLLTGSVVANYAMGVLIERLQQRGRSVNWALALGVCLNLLVLGYYKYANFFLDAVNTIAGTDYSLQRVLLPLGISFYTFQQIAYLVDIARGNVQSQGLGSYAAFVIFFPQLLSGPISHYRDIAPQFFKKNLGKYWQSNLIVGLAMFSIGLFKKTVIADSASVYVTPLFVAAHAGETLGLVASWSAMLCYAIQLYFDFSGYSDMATGAARMFGIKLPLNFFSPLRSTSIIDYWRRWHISLHHFIVTYMYQPCVLPLARIASERGLKRWGNFWLTVALPTTTIFVAVGLWHGAGWSYILFGVLHGVYLTTNEFWRLWWRSERKKTGMPTGWQLNVYHLLTLVCVIFSYVLFRAERVSDAIAVWKGMTRLDQIGQLPSALPLNLSEAFSKPFFLILAGFLILMLFPNTQQIMGRFSPVLEWSKWRNVARPAINFEFRLTVVWAVYLGIVLFLGLVFISRGQTQFIYFNF